MCSTASRTSALASTGDRLARFSQACSMVVCRSRVMTAQLFQG
ncbi:Uncharacterised protein [Bordetella pertussis]|nr:Uncharacterised protein [Bordetella pertussis]